MDSKSDFEQVLSFSNLEERYKSLEDSFEALLNRTKENKFPYVEPEGKRNVSPREARELKATAKQIQESQKQLLNEHEELTKDLRQVNTKVKALNKSLLKLVEAPTEENNSKPKEKALMRAIKKYSEQLNMHVDVRNADDNTFIASVKFASKRDSKSVDFVIDRKHRSVLDFNASSVVSDEEAAKLKTEAKFQDGYDVEVLLAKLRKLCL